MANYTATVDMTLEQAITNGGMIDTESLTINDGAVVTCDQTPSILLGGITINDGELLIDGVNISAGNMINFVGNYTDQITVNGRGLLHTTGKWYSVGSTDGTDSQSFDLTTYFNSTLYDVIPMIQVETGRRIDYNNSSGILPEIDDCVHLSSDHSIMGRIIEIQSTYIVVRLLTGSLSNGDTIEVRKIIDNNGPDLQTSWTATVNNVLGDIKEVGIYQEFGNSRANGISYIGSFSHKIGGLVFDHQFQSVNLIMGGNSAGVLGGFIPPSGCDVRIPNVQFSTSDATNFPLGQTYHDGTATETNQYNLSTGGAGEVIFNVCNLGSVSFNPNFPSVYEAYFTGACMEMGADSAASKIIVHNCVVVSDPMNRSTSTYRAFKAFDLVNGIEIIDCMSICPQIEARTIGVDTSSDILIKGCIFSCAGGASWQTSSTVGAYKFQFCNNITLENNTAVGFDGTLSPFAIYADGCSNMNVKMHRVAYTQDGTPQLNEREGFILKNGCSDINIVGIEIIGGAVPGDNLVEVTDISNFKVRCFGMVDNKVDFGIDAEYVVALQGFCSNINIARMWKTSGATPVGILSSKTVRNLTVSNCSGDYSGEIETSGGDLIQWKGVHGGSGGIGSSSGVETDLPASYGSHCHDIFRSDTTGALFIVFTPKTINTSAHYTVTAGNPKFFRDGDMDMIDGDQIEYEMQYYALGHTSFTGVYTTTTGSATDGQDEWGSNITKEFQYDVNDGNGYNGTWLDVTIPANLTGITIDPSLGIKLKCRFTCVTARTNMCGFMIHTNTTINDQKSNLYPIDQNYVGVRVTALSASDSTPINGAMVLLEADTGGPLPAGTDILKGITNSSGYIEDTSFLFSLNQPVIGKIRQGTTPPYYKTSLITGTITSIGLDITGFMVDDQ